MAEVYIGNLPAASALSGAEVFPIEQGGTPTTKKATATQIRTFTLASVGAAGLSNSYNDLDDLPSLFSGSYSDLTGKPTLFDGAFASLTGKPTTLGGYGIIDAYPLVGNPSGFLTSAPVTSVFGRTGAVVAASNDYTWAQIDKTTSSLADIATRSASDLSSGTLPDARFPATLPAVSGVNLTALNASNLASGTVAAARGGAGTVSGIMKANGSGVVSAAASGTDYEAPITFSTGLTRTVNTVVVDTSVIATKAYADSLVVGLLDDRGNFDASGNLFPSSGGSGSAGAILKGDLWTISVAGTLGGVAVTAGDLVRALVDTPGQTAGNWAVSETNIGYTALNAALLSGKFYVGNGSNVGAAVTPTGDVTFDNAGVFTIGATKVTNAMLAGSVTAAKLVKTDITTVGALSSGSLAAGFVVGAVTMTLGSDADGDIYYRSGSVLTRLAKGTALQGLRMNAGATAPEWATISASMVVGTTPVTSGSAGRFFYETSGNVLGEVTTLTSDGTIVTYAGTTTTGTTTSAGFVVTSNALTTGTGFYVGSTSTAGSSTTSVLFDVSRSGAQTGTVTTTAARIANTATGASATNVALTLTASGATTANQALNVTAGQSIFPAGTVSAPAVAVGAVGDGLYSISSGVLGIVTGGADRIVLNSNGVAVHSRLGIGSTAQSADVFLRRSAAANLAFGAADAASPVAQTLSVQNVVSGTSNTAGAAWTFSDSAGTGTGASGGFVFQTHPAGSSGTSQNAAVTALTINSAGQTIVSDGLVGTPGLRGSDADSGLYFTNSGKQISWAVDGAVIQFTNSNGLTIYPSAGTLTVGGDAIIGRAAAANLRHGAADAASPVNQTISTQGSRAGTDTNTAGANLTIQSGLGTGTAALSSLILKSPIAVGSGSGAQTATTGLTIIGGTAKLTGYTVATLPTASATLQGSIAYVTDATLNVITGLGIAPTGGGSNVVPVFCDGTTWLII